MNSCGCANCCDMVWYDSILIWKWLWKLIKNFLFSVAVKSTVLATCNTAESNVVRRQPIELRLRSMMKWTRVQFKWMFYVVFCFGFCRLQSNKCGTKSRSIKRRPHLKHFCTLPIVEVVSVVLARTIFRRPHFWSYTFRLCGSDKTRNALEIFLNVSSPRWFLSGLPRNWVLKIRIQLVRVHAQRLKSGWPLRYDTHWYLRASLWYAFFISSGEAVGATPSISYSPLTQSISVKQNLR